MDDIQQKIAIISNIVLEPYFTQFMKQQFGNKTNIYYLLYGMHTEVESQNIIKTCNTIIVWLNYWSLFPDIWNLVFSKVKDIQNVIEELSELCLTLYLYLKKHTNANILWFLFEDYYAKNSVVTGHNLICNGLIDKLNLKIYSEIYNEVSFVDLKFLISEIGIINGYNYKHKYRWNAPYSKLLIENAVKEIYKNYLIRQGITKKCLILDCDNVLWGGILSEDGIENVKLGSSGMGQKFQDFQRFILFLYYHGVILSICSKNDLSSVMDMFHNHKEMILKEDNIACFKVNWNNKPDNIKQIAEFLNIAFDSIVFIDDSLIEVEAVKLMLPDVTTILYNHDSIYEQLRCFNLKNRIDITEIEKRNITYRTNQEREIQKLIYNNYSDYIASLEIKMDIHETSHIEFNRISELTQRTNKYTNGTRYNIHEIKERINSNYIKLYSVSVSDRFSDLGIVGAIEIEKEILTLFSLSCRALGRDIEKRMLEFISKKHKIEEIFYKSTGKNGDLKSLLLNVFPNATLQQY